MMFRRWTATGLAVAGFTLVLAGTVVGYAGGVILDSDTFAERAAASLADERVARYAASRLTDAAVRQDPDLIRVRPLLEGAAEVTVRSRPFRALAERSLAYSHRLFLDEGQGSLLLTLADAGVVLRSVLAVSPELADAIPDDIAVAVAEVDSLPGTQYVAEVTRVGRRLRGNARLALAGGLLLVALALVVSPQRRRTALHAGLALLGAGALVFMLMLFGGATVRTLVPGDPALAGALAGLYDAFAAGLRPHAVLLGSLGLLILAGATARVQSLDAWSRGRDAVERLGTVPAAPTARAGRIVALLAVGAIAVIAPGLTARIAVVVAGAGVAFAGLQDLLRWVLPAHAAPHAPTRAGVSARAAVMVVLGVVIVSAIVLVPGGSPPRLVPHDAGDRYNGLAGLGGRPLDAVVFPTAHNAMGAGDVPGWMFPNHSYGIPRQLEDGIRGFMIDVHPGRRVGSRVRTELDGELAREEYEPILGAEGVDAALRIRDRLLRGEAGPRELFLCHGLCEIGAEELLPVLRDMRDFLVLHPQEVLILVVEDYVPSAELAAALVESGLADFAYRRPPGPPWPTLREMVAAGERVLITAENDASGAPWIHRAWDVFQETPYHFSTMDEFSCEPNRGGTTGSLFTVNHWVTDPPSARPSVAARVNAYDLLRGRVRRCRSERGKLPNLVAVDFYDLGDLFRVVRELNTAPR